MTVVTLVSPPAASPAVSCGVRELLAEVDEEFVPRLSARMDTLSLRPRADSPEAGLPAYFDAMRLESWLVAFHGDLVVGLLSFVLRSDDPVLAAWSPSLYATTVAVSQRARQAGVATDLYGTLEHVARQQATPYLTTRTWSTNAAHIRILLARGFRQVMHVPDDRAVAIGTVYFACRVSTSSPVTSAAG